MGKNLFVANIPFTTTEDQLHALFSEFGTVESARILTYPESGRSKGYGFVEMSSDDEAMSCIEKLDGKDLEGRPLKVNEARPRAPRTGGPGGGGPRKFGGGGGRPRNGGGGGYGGGGPRHGGGGGRGGGGYRD